MKNVFFRNLGQTIGVVGGIAVLSVLLIFALYTRDYDLEIVDGRPQFVAEISIPTPTVLRLNTMQPGKITMETGHLPNVESYQFRIAGNSAMFLAKSYRTQATGHTEANLKAGKTYYIQVRACKENESGRIVYGKWGSKKSATVK